MALVQDDAAGRRLWQGLGGLIFGDQAGQESDFIVSSRNGQITLDARPAAPAPQVLGNVAGYQVTTTTVLAIVLLVGVAFLVVKK